METVVSMLQEDAVVPATAPPPPKYRPCWCLQQHPSGSWGPVGWGTRWGGWEQMEQNCVRRSWRNHGRSPGPQTDLPSAGLPGGGLAPIDRSAGEGWLCRGAAPRPPPLPTGSPCGLWGCRGSRSHGSPPRRGASGLA